MKNKIKQITGLILVAMIVFAGCGGGSEANHKEDAQKEADGLSEFEQIHGIGPISEVVTVNAVDQEIIEKGRSLFKTKCSACHKIGERYVGPDLGMVLEKRTPTYVMNMILNPDGMVKEHPEAKKLLAEFLAPMPNQNLEQEEARAIVAYLASEQHEVDEAEDEDEQEESEDTN